MTQEDKDLCKTCEHYWVDFVVNPYKKYIGHCEIIDERYSFDIMDNLVPYPCLKCPFCCYKKGINYE